ncbi:MAG: hypothetical protein MZV63_10880 [Marinilabiliales bacterium]|nr:hypothetical protein [Marinilabiliales bacterium]
MDIGKIFYLTHTAQYDNRVSLQELLLFQSILSQVTALKICTILGVIFSLGAILTPAHHGFHDAVHRYYDIQIDRTCSACNSTYLWPCYGLANALVWPAMWPLALNGLGRFTKTASAMLIMAIAGGALIPLLYGKLAVNFSTQAAYWLCVPCIPCYYVLCFYRT